MVSRLVRYMAHTRPQDGRGSRSRQQTWSARALNRGNKEQEGERKEKLKRRFGEDCRREFATRDFSDRADRLNESMITGNNR